MWKDTSKKCGLAGQKDRPKKWMSPDPTSTAGPTHPDGGGAEGGAGGVPLGHGGGEAAQHRDGEGPQRGPELHDAG